MAPSYIRTMVPIVVGWLAGHGGLAWLGVNDPMALTVVSAGMTLVYYAFVRALEEQWPQAGWLLGFPDPPSYTQAQMLAALLRTLVPFLTAVAVHFGVGRLGVDEAAVTNMLTALISSGWYAGIRYVEGRGGRWRWVGILLGFPRQPSYASD